MRKGKLLGGILACVLASGFVFFSYYGFYTIQPLGVIPDGMTLIVRRYDGEPIFNSPDAVCLKHFGGVSLMGRAAALKEVSTRKRIAKLPYIERFYKISVDGRDFE